MSGEGSLGVAEEVKGENTENGIPTTPMKEVGILGGQISLSNDKEELIAHLREIVGELDFDESVRVMEDNNWDLEQAIHKIMDIPIPSEVSSDSFLQSSFQDPHVTTPSYAPSTQGVRRRNIGLNTTVEVNSHKVIRYTPTIHSPWYWQILSIIFSPFQKLLDMFYYLFSAFQPDALLVTGDPVSDVKSFVNQLELEATSAISLPNFIQRSYGQCLSEAKDNLQFLVVYLHDNTSECTTMVREVLCSEKFKRLIHEENVLLWGCSIKTPEGCQVSRLLRQNKYPFIGCIGIQGNNKMTLLARIEGLFKCDEMVVKLRSVLHSHEGPMVAARVDREERTRNQHLRLQQDIDYAESLRQDREKDEAKKCQRDNEERLRVQRVMEEQKEQRRKEEMIDIRNKIIKKMPVEADNVDGTLLVRVQFPSGQVSRRFYITDSLKLLFYLVKSQSNAPWDFEISSNFPKRMWPVTPTHFEYNNDEIVREPRSHFDDPPSFKDFNVVTNITVMVMDNDA